MTYNFKYPLSLILLFVFTNLISQTCPQSAISGRLDSNDPVYEWRFYDNATGFCFPDRPAPPVRGFPSPWLTYYDVFEFTVSAAGQYTFTGSGDFFYLAHLYLENFDPNLPCNNLVLFEDGTEFSSPSFTLNVTTAPATYVLVTSNFTPNEELDYTWTFSSPPNGNILSNGPDLCETPIPTFSQWGKYIFGLLILNIGVLILRKKELAL